MLRCRRPATMIVAATLMLISSAAQARSLQTQILGMLRGDDLRETKVSLLIQDVATGERIAWYNPDEPMIPASNMKLITTAAALGMLGEDFAFETKLSIIRPEDWENENAAQTYEKRDDRGTILVIKGDGDPAFGDPQLLEETGLNVEQLVMAWVNAVKKTGVTSVKKLIVDDRIFDDEFVHPTWPVEQLNRGYCAQVAGLNFHNNVVYVYPAPARSAGLSPLITIKPEMSFILARTRNRAETGYNDTFWVSRKLGTNEMTFWGKVKHARTLPVEVTFDDPPMVFAQYFVDKLKANGIAVESFERPGNDDLMPPGQVIHVVKTPLAEVVRRCNKDSENLYAEAMLKRLGRQVTGAPGGWGNGAAGVRMFLNQKVGRSAASVRVADGSGMSRDNRVTARILIDLLCAMYKDPALREVYRKSLAVGGVDGTLEKRFDDLDLRSMVFAKSGYINEVCTLSGYIVLPPVAENKNETQQVIAFSMLFNDVKPPVFVHEVKALQEKIIKLLDDELVIKPNGAKLGG